MKFFYYPGCTLKTTATSLNTTAINCAKYLNIDFVELENWQCCGGIYSLNRRNIVTKLPSFRVLKHCKDNNLSLLTLCSGCYNTLKRVNYDLQNDITFCTTINTYNESQEFYNGETKIYHYLEVLKNFIGFDKIKNLIKKPLNKKVACYYGCLLLRPSNIINFDNSENPTIMEELIQSLKGENINFDLKNYCCGSYKSLDNENIVKRNVEKIVSNAISNGAEIIITSCPLCHYNLKKYASIEVKFFTEILAECLGVENE